MSRHEGTQKVECARHKGHHKVSATHPPRASIHAHCPRQQAAQQKQHGIPNAPPFFFETQSKNTSKQASVGFGFVSLHSCIARDNTYGIPHTRSILLWKPNEDTRLCGYGF